MTKLPSEPIQPTKVSPAVMIIYGATKIGKARVLADLEKNLILDLERGAETYKCIRIRMDSYEEFIDATSSLSEEENKGKFTFLTIDTIDRLVEWLEIEVVNDWNESQKRVKEPVYVKVYSEIPYGKGYDLVRLKMRKWTNYLRKQVPHLILVGHLKRTIIGETTVEIDEANLDLTGKLRNLVFADADLIAYAFRKENELKFSFKPSNITGGGRIPKLDGKIITISKKDEKGKIKTDWKQIFK